MEVNASLVLTQNLLRFQQRLFKARWWVRCWLRGRVFSSQIKFGKKELTLLLDGVESRNENVGLNSHRKVGKEGERIFKMEMCNKARRFLLCFVFPMEKKIFTLIFSKERGFLRGGSFSLQSQGIQGQSLLTGLNKKHKGLIFSCRGKKRVPK